MARLRFYDFFAGAGMVELALQTEWECAFANDIDPRKAAVHRANLDHSMYLTADIATLAAADLPSPVDLAWASFPCQDLSLAGWRRGMSAGRSGAFWAFWTLMRDLDDRDRRPPMIVIENVAGLLYGEHFRGLCEALAALDLQFGALLIDADRFLPQSRPRVFVVAVDRSLNVAPWTEAVPEVSPWFPQNVRRAFAALPPSLHDRWRWWRLPPPDGSRRAPIEHLIEDQPTGVAWHTEAETARLLSLMSPLNRDKVEDRRGRGGRFVGFVYKRTRQDGQRAEIRFDGVAGCLRTPYGGSSRQTVLIVDDGRVRSRLLSPREAARLMGIPDHFRLPDRYNDAYRAMGDGVAVPAVAWLGKHLLTPLARHARGAVRGRDEDNGNVIEFRRSAEEQASRWAAVKA
ncbi:MAG TPA: DNA cytosine methyltransferase [Methylomirabilota bacterium]|nr:DNA cytosine methyltransferase [Methylomirabilota bacterium]